MPELPEVEIIRLQLACLLAGLEVKSAKVYKKKLFKGARSLIIGKKVVGVRRFAKILVIDFQERVSLAVHLKMSGQLVFLRAVNHKLETGRKTLLKHVRVVIVFNDNSKLIFSSMRMFGWMKVIQNRTRREQKTLNFLTEKLGLDALKDLSCLEFQAIVSHTRRPIKLVLMDQSKIGGVGNIYANEALFCADINPEKKSSTLSKRQIERLYICLKKVLRMGIKWGGTSSSLYVDAFGKKGKAQNYLKVYGREGDFCLNNCGKRIKRVKLAGRGTFYCPYCQR